MNITIGHLYPDLLNLYGDRGNIQCLKKRCEWRGIRAEVKEFRSGDKVDFQDLDIIDEEKAVPRKADLRAFVLMGEEPVVWKSGLTRFSRNPDSFIVNSSQGGGFKDTWVLYQ